MTRGFRCYNCSEFTQAIAPNAKREPACTYMFHAELVHK